MGTAPSTEAIAELAAEVRAIGREFKAIIDEPDGVQDTRKMLARRADLYRRVQGAMQHLAILTDDDDEHWFDLLLSGLAERAAIRVEDVYRGAADAEQG